LNALAWKEVAIDRRLRSVGNTLATPINPNKKSQGRGWRESAVSLEAGDQQPPFSNGGGGNDGNFEMPPIYKVLRIPS